ncbi:unnamed protein product [Parnassius apollo]|uniref:(apollo) hypothetical protein n=1 Tax=Parnassius apollo TaxID=110799 RepID=A0A8S3WA15_PARAO|nr:unnamed protein product [Parnassius apollo]
MDENQISEEEAMNSILIENNEQETEICLPEKSAQCQAMIYDEELGWRFQKPLEAAFSYGVIKDIELEMTEKEMLEVISSDCELIGVKRLKRRKTDGKGWEDSESIQLQFKGSSLPASVYIYGMKINVDP